MQHRGDLYIIRLGSAEVFRAADGSPRVLARLTRNDHFGEIALLAPELTAEERLEPLPVWEQAEEQVL